MPGTIRERMNICNRGDAMGNHPNKMTMRKIPGLTGVPVNTMARIAPGRFPWITFQLPAAAGMDKDIRGGLPFALIIAFVAAHSFAEPARKHPDAGGSCCFLRRQPWTAACRPPAFRTRIQINPAGRRAAQNGCGTAALPAGRSFHPCKALRGNDRSSPIRRPAEFYRPAEIRRRRNGS
ncbi:MAG: hypothetical protein JW748_00380 [Anaerolineales bacterium]|nr:hypothetical protein [Anaerolineales bacterium]